MEGVARIYKKKPKGSWVTLSLPGSDWLCSYAHIFANVLYYHCRALPAIVLMLHKPAGPLTPSNTTPTSPVSSTEKTSPSRFCHRETSHLEGGRKPPKSPPEGHTTSKHTRSHLIPTQRKYKSTQESTPYKIKNHNPMLRSKRTIIYIYIYTSYHPPPRPLSQPLEQFQAFSLLRWIFAFAAGKASKRGLGYTRVKVAWRRYTMYGFNI